MEKKRKQRNRKRRGKNKNKRKVGRRIGIEESVEKGRRGVKRENRKQSFFLLFWCREDMQNEEYE
jgi:hypothetical protein